MAVSIYFTIVDGKGDPSTREFFFNDATPLAVLAAGVPAVAALIQPLVDGGLRTAGFRVEVDVSGTWGPIAQIAADIQEQAEFAMRTVNGFLSRLSLPTFDEQFFLPQSTEVDTSDPDVQAFITFLEDGMTVGGGDLEPSDYREDDIANVEAVSEAWGRKRGAR